MDFRRNNSPYIGGHKAKRRNANLRKIRNVNQTHCTSKSSCFKLIEHADVWVIISLLESTSTMCMYTEIESRWRRVNNLLVTEI